MLLVAELVEIVRGGQNLGWHCGASNGEVWYLNDCVNAEYTMTALNDGYLDMPVLFLNARYDYVRECTHSRLAEPISTYCRQPTEEMIRSDHWLAQGKAVEVNAALVKWLATKAVGRTR